MRLSNDCFREKNFLAHPLSANVLIRIPSLFIFRVAKLFARRKGGRRRESQVGKFEKPWPREATNAGLNARHESNLPRQLLDICGLHSARNLRDLSTNSSNAGTTPGF